MSKGPIQLEVVDGQLEQYHFGNGRVAFEANGTPHFQYTIKDHLGNTVVLFEDKNDDGEIELDPATPADTEVLQRDFYYPFGLSFRGDWNRVDAPNYDYLYNGKELVEDAWLEWYAYGARWYDAAVGRFVRVDESK